MYENIYDYTNKKLLCWVTYNPNYYDLSSREGKESKVLYVYPQYYEDADSLVAIKNAKDIFPKKGAFEVFCLDTTAKKLVDELMGAGQISGPVGIQFREMPEQDEEAINNELRFNYYNYNNVNKRGFYNRTQISIKPIKVMFPYLYHVIERENFNPTSEKDLIISGSDALNFNKNNIIYISNQKRYWGPFECESKQDDKLKLNGLESRHRFYVAPYNELPIYALKDQNDHEICRLTIEHEKEAYNIEGCIDAIPSTVLEREFNKYLKKNETAVGNKERRQYREIFKNFVDSDWSPDIITDDRKSRLNELYSKVERNSFVDDVIDAIMSTDNSEVKNKVMDRLLSERIEDVDEMLRSKAEYIKIENEYRKKKEEIIQLENEILNLSTESAELQSKHKKQVEEETAELQKQKLALEAELPKLKEIVDKENELKKLSNAIDKKQNEHNALVSLKERLSKEVETVMDNFDSRIIRDEVYEKALTALNTMRKNKEASSFEAGMFVQEAENMEAEQIISDLQRKLEAVGRNGLARNDVVNLLICITQGFVTTFVGAPGTGKTSLCNLIGDAMGLSKCNRYQEISVERGWLSHRDYIGYHNPITGQIEAANSTALLAMEQLHHEAENSNHDSFFIMLLDEANLSPIEHYWANFMRITDLDKRQKDRYISLGGSNTFLIPPTLRFLATLNFDHTTEELSPRFIDRSWVIHLNSEIHSVDDLETTRSEEIIRERPIAFNCYQEHFARSNGENQEPINRRLNSIIDVFIANKLPLSYRSINMIRNYTITANKYMEKSSTYTTLDYAVVQKLLPIINGNGDRYEQLIEELLRVTQGMDQCQRELTRVLETGQEDMSKYYSFFNNLI